MKNTHHFHNSVTKLVRKYSKTSEKKDNLRVRGRHIAVKFRGKGTKRALRERKRQAVTSLTRSRVVGDLPLI